MMSLYIPDTFKIGLYKRMSPSKEDLLDRKDIPLHDMQFGFPSCKWLGSKQWTEASKFSALCDGYKPSEQRNDPEKEIEKAIGLHVKEVSNEWTEGFKFIHLDGGTCLNSSSYAVLRDPRGFCISLEGAKFFCLLNYTDMSIGSDGSMSGKFKYAWSNGKWAGIDRKDSGNTYVTDNELKSKISKMVSAKDMQPGTVYEVMPSMMYDATVKLLYVGDYMLPSKEQMSKVMHRYFTNYELGRLHTAASFCDIRQDMLPWKNETYVSKAKKLHSSVSMVPVFVMLDSKVIISALNPRVNTALNPHLNAEQYCLHSILGSSNTQQCTVNLYPFCFHDLFNEDITWSKTILKHIAAKSKRQLNDRPGSLDEYNTYSFSQIKTAVDKVADRVSKTLELMEKLRPYEALETGSQEHSQWTSLLRGLKFRNNTIFTDALVALSK